MVLGAGAHVVRIYFCERKNIIQWRKTAISERKEKDTYSIPGLGRRRSVCNGHRYDKARKRGTEYRRLYCESKRAYVSDGYQGRVRRAMEQRTITHSRQGAHYNVRACLCRGAPRSRIGSNQTPLD